MWNELEVLSHRYKTRKIKELQLGKEVIILYMQMTASSMNNILKNLQKKLLELINEMMDCKIQMIHKKQFYFYIIAIGN